MTVLVCMLQCNVFGVAVVICVETFALLACTALMQFAVHALFHCAMLLLSYQLGWHRQQQANQQKHKERKKEKKKNNTKQPKTGCRWWLARSSHWVLSPSRSPVGTRPHKCEGGSRTRTGGNTQPCCMLPCFALSRGPADSWSQPSPIGRLAVPT